MLEETETALRGISSEEGFIWFKDSNKGFPESGTSRPVTSHAHYKQCTSRRLAERQTPQVLMLPSSKLITPRTRSLTASLAALRWNSGSFFFQATSVMVPLVSLLSISLQHEKIIPREAIRNTCETVHHFSRDVINAEVPPSRNCVLSSLKMWLMFVMLWIDSNVCGNMFGNNARSSCYLLNNTTIIYIG